jgi:histidinol-phosphate aminotransferase
LRDRAHIERAIAHNETWRSWLTEEIRNLGLRADDSAGNFVLVHFVNPQTARAADEFLLARGIALRPVGAYGLPACLRLTVGLEQANRATVAALAEFVNDR